MGGQSEVLFVPGARRVMSRLAALVMVIALAGVLGAGASPASAATTTYGFWNLDGCHYTWAGPAEGFRKGQCGPENYSSWGRGAGANQLFHWDGQKWQFQGIFSQGTMDTPNGIFIVPYVSAAETHLFVWEYAEQAWYHFFIVTQSVQSVPNEPQLETATGWHPLSEFSDPTLGTMLREWERLKDTIIQV
jgi:hypothetical protein